MEIILLVLAVVVDLALGEPPNTFHPVAWMGSAVSFLEKFGPRASPAGQFFYGVLITALIVALFAVPAYYLLAYIARSVEYNRHFGLLVYIIAATFLLKSTFSIRGLRRAAQKIRALLLEEHETEARFELHALVSRDTKELTQPLMVSAAVESVAEGTCDSLVAPLFYYLLLGIPGAIAYRAVNTLDAMIGYHGKYEYLGKFAARLDDVANFIPARLAAMLLVVAAWLTQKTGRLAWRTALREHTKTESPNAGWPMAAMAGALDARLEKPGHYILGEDKKKLQPATIDNAVKVFSLAALAWILICLAAGGIRFAVKA
ncbi:MAG: cobalamin biosynthesis protein CobD [Chloroflexi bacterium RBG_16_56_11]|nr:MAG: cobalamin biosynthesis protein CobD [Chloroflexi bacterium RBG_16_56_11]